MSLGRATVRLRGRPSVHRERQRAHPCASDASCAAGFACLDLGFGNECTRWCNYTTGAGCGLGYFCDDVFTVPAIIGSRQYGVCT